MVQEFKVFQGLPADLVKELDALKANGKTIIQVVTTSVSANYVIIYGEEAP